MEELSIKNQARLLAKEAAGDLAVVNKIRGDLVVMMTDGARKGMTTQEWVDTVGRAIRIAIPGWVVIRQVGGLMIFRMAYSKGARP